MSDRADAIASLEQELGYRFRDRDLLDRALTHASVRGVSRSAEHNQQLEFLGDRVLGLLTAEWLVEQHPSEREGPLSNRLHSVVNRDACARVARRIGVANAMRKVSVSTRKPSHAADSLLSDAAEALLAALYLDAGLERTREVFLRIWGPELNQATPSQANPKVALQHWLLAEGHGLPRYEVAERTGPAHEPTFTVTVSVQGLDPAEGRGRSRQEAEKVAAQVMLEREVGP